MTGLVERYRAAHLPLPLDEPYFQRLLRGYRGRPARVRVIPFSYTPAPAALAGLEAVVARAFGGSCGDDRRRSRSATAPRMRSPTVATVGVGLRRSSRCSTRARRRSARCTARSSRRCASSFTAPKRCWRWSTKAPGRRVGGTSRRGSPTGARPGERLGDEAHVPMVFVDLSAPDLLPRQARRRRDRQCATTRRRRSRRGGNSVATALATALTKHGCERGVHHRAVADLAHQRGQDDACAHAPRPRRRHRARRAARHAGSHARIR